MFLSILLKNSFWPGAHSIWEALPKETQCRLWGLLHLWIQAHHWHLLQRQRSLWDGLQWANNWPEHSVKGREVGTIVQQLQELLYTTGKQKLNICFLNDLNWISNRCLLLRTLPTSQLYVLVVTRYYVRLVKVQIICFIIWHSFPD